MKHFFLTLVDSNSFAGMKKIFGGAKGDREFVDPFTMVRFAGKEASFSRVTNVQDLPFLSSSFSEVIVGIL